MITVGKSKKILLFDVSTEGIDFSDLEFWFRIYDEEVVYSFKGELLESENKVKVIVPPITRMINRKYLNLERPHNASLEVIGEGKYFISTWEGEIKLETNPCVDTKLVSETTHYNENSVQQKKEEQPRDIVSSVSEEKETKIENKMDDELTEGFISEKVQEGAPDNIEGTKETKNKGYKSSLLEEVLNRTSEIEKPKSKESILSELI